MSGNARRLITHLLGLAIVSIMIGYLVTQSDLMANLLAVPLGALAAVVALSLIVHFVFGFQFEQACRVFGLGMRYRDALFLAVTNSMLNYALPLKGGMIMRAGYMKRRFSLSYTSYGALLSSSQLVALACAAGAGVVVSGFHSIGGGEVSRALVSGFAVALVLSLAGFRLIERVDSSRMRSVWLGQRIARFSEGFGRWRRHPRRVGWFVGTVLAMILIQTARLLILFGALDASPGVTPLLVISSAIAVANSVPITPGNLGIKEATTSLSAALIGVDARVALLVSLVDRAVGLLVTVGLGLPFSHQLARGLREHDLAAEEE